MKAVALLSGGLDSAVALAMQNIDYAGVHALTIDYGQRHRREITAATRIAEHYNISHIVAQLPPVLFRGSALTGTGPIPTDPATEPDSTYVPARNTVLLATAAAYAESIGARKIIIGCNADDGAGYPDCRPAYIEAFRDVLQTGTVGHVWVSAPLMTFTKRRIIALATELDVPVHLTWSCYDGGPEPCGQCGACQLRDAALT